MLITSLLNLSASTQQINRLYILWQLDFNGSISTKIQNKNHVKATSVIVSPTDWLCPCGHTCGTPWSQCFMIHTCSQDPFLLFQPLHHHGQEPTSCSNIQTVDKAVMVHSNKLTENYLEMEMACGRRIFLIRWR